MPRGGRRLGAGGKPGQVAHNARYGGPTKVVRVPQNLAPRIDEIIAREQRMETALAELREEIAAAELRAGGRPLNSRWHVAQRWLAEIEQAWSGEGAG